MDDITWCKKQDKGIKFIEPNENLSKEYLESSRETFEDIKKDESNMWKATKKYYFEYFLIYSFLIRAGIKCEIHDCTILLSKMLEENNFLPEKTHKTLQQDKKLRIENQYYLKNKEIKISFQEMSEFYLKMKNKINSLSSEEIKQIKNLVKIKK